MSPTNNIPRYAVIPTWEKARKKMKNCETVFSVYSFNKTIKFSTPLDIQIAATSILNIELGNIRYREHSMSEQRFSGFIKQHKAGRSM